MRLDNETENECAYREDCARHIDSPGIAACEFYRCRERNEAHRCGPEGYYLGYGLKYCERFTRDVRPKLTDSGKVWVDTTRVCLTRFIHEHVPPGTSCDEVRDAAFRSHAHCYLAHGVCSLGPHDWYQIVAAVDDWELREVLLTGLGCISDWGASAAHGLVHVAMGLAHTGSRVRQEGWTRLRASVSTGSATRLPAPHDRFWPGTVGPVGDRAVVDGHAQAKAPQPWPRTTEVRRALTMPKTSRVVGRSARRRRDPGVGSTLAA